jgi:hypothetical protein
MALEERTRIREVLFAQSDGTLEWAAHQVPITEIFSDGVLIAATYGDAQPLDPAGAGQVLEPAMVAICAQNAALQARIKQLEIDLIEARKVPEIKPASSSTSH